MEEIIRTGDPVLVSAVEALLSGEDIDYLVADRHVSALEARIAAFPMRILVATEDAPRARRAIVETGWGDTLRVGPP